jgi:hypothetical protein
MMLNRRRTAAAIAGVVALGGLAAGISLSVTGGNGGSGAKPSASPHSPSPSPSNTAPAVNPLTGSGPGGHVLAVKIDNVGDAQYEQAGLNSADLVYVIQVEGGLSRYLAVFDSNNAPSQVGPVRSARQTDIPLLAAYGDVGFAYSGAISGLLPKLAAANLHTITPDSNASLFSNQGSSPTYIDPKTIFSTYPNLAETQNVGFVFGAMPAGGQAASSASVSMPAASFTFTASGTTWLVSVDGHPAETTDQGRTSADNVIVQHVQVVPGEFTDHNAAQPANEVFSETTGQGAADFYRDGEVWHGQWSKPTDTSPTSYTVDGKPMQLEQGRTWIVLAG